MPTNKRGWSRTDANSAERSRARGTKARRSAAPQCSRAIALSCCSTTVLFAATVEELRKRPLGITRETWNERPYDGGMTDEQPRSFANGDEHNYTLTVEEAADQYARAGIPRTQRAIQKYCAVSKLDCRKTETEFGEKYLVAPYSIDRHIAYIKSIKPVTDDANSRVHSRPVANVPPSTTVSEEPRTETTNTDEQPRPVANAPQTDERLIAALERENTFLRDQILVKDTQIKSLTDHSQQTNVLMQSFQRLLAPLLGSGEPTDKINSRESTGSI